MIWGIVPLYFGLLLNELTSPKANYRTAMQTGFGFLWAGAQWLYLYTKAHHAGASQAVHATVVGPLSGTPPPVNLVVTFLVLALGGLALWSGFRKRYPKYGSFLGYSRFSNYLMIAIYPIQAHRLEWSWERLVAIALFAVPIWLVLNFGLMPFRGKK